MLSGTAAFWSGLALGAAAGLVFWFVNGIHRVNGIGLLRRQDWPISSPGVWIAIGFAIGAVSELIQSARRAGHARKTRALADELGWEYTESYSLPPRASSMPVFAGWSNGRNAMTGREGDLPITVFDYTTIIPGSESDVVTDGTAVLLPVDDLAAFTLRPRTLGRRLLGWAGIEGLTFDPSAADPHDAETVRRFGELFHLCAVDPITLIGSASENGPAELADREDAVRRLFTPTLMAVVNQHPEHAIQSHPGFLAVWCGSGVLPARKRTELCATAVEFRTLLTHPPTGGASPVVAARAGTDASRQIRMFRNTLAGGVIGLFGGFILAAMITSIVFFRALPGRGPGLGFFLLPVLFIGSILVGAALGAAIGSRVPVRTLPPGPMEDPARRTARQRATMRAALVGLFGGFFGGFGVFAASKILFDWKVGDFGVESALFFGSSFGGALFGALLCATVVNRLYRRGRPGPTSQDPLNESGSR